MKALLKREDMWDLVERKLTQASFPTTVGASTFAAEQFKIQKLKAQALLVMVVKDEFVEIVSDTKDPSNTWHSLKNIFEGEDSS